MLSPGSLQRSVKDSRGAAIICNIHTGYHEVPQDTYNHIVEVSEVRLSEDLRWMSSSGSTGRSLWWRRLSDADERGDKVMSQRPPMAP